jgi:hypothetical protein
VLIVQKLVSHQSEVFLGFIYPFLKKLVFILVAGSSLAIVFQFLHPYFYYMSQVLRQIEERRQSALAELQEVEKLIFKLETAYLRDTAGEGNIIKGWDSLLNSKSLKQNSYSLTRKLTSNKTLSEQDRIFSLSSASGPLKQSQEDDHSENMLPYKRKSSMSAKKIGISKRLKTRRDDDDPDYSEG